MVRYSVILLVPYDVYTAWLVWMRNTHIPLILESKLTVSPSGNIRTVLETDVWTKEEQKNMRCVEVEYFFESDEAYAKYIAEHAPQRREEYTDKKWGTLAKRHASTVDLPIYN